MSGQITDEDCSALFQASQAIWACTEKSKARRQTELELLYLAVKNSRQTDLIIDLISTFNDEITVLCDAYAESVKAHADAVVELRRQRQQTRTTTPRKSTMIRPITDTLRHIGGGIFIDMASDKMSELVASVDATGKSGKLNLEIGVKKATRGGAMHITGKIRLTKPAKDAMEAMLFATPEGNLVADDPHQQKLDLKSIENKAVPAPLMKTA